MVAGLLKCSSQNPVGPEIPGFQSNRRAQQAFGGHQWCMCVESREVTPKQEHEHRDGPVAAALGAGFLLMAWRVFRVRDGFEADKASRQLFTFSILYLFAIFGALWVDHGFGLGR